MPLPHTTSITKTNTTHFLLLFSLFFSATFASPFVFFISPLSLFSSTHFFNLSSFKFQHLSVKKVSTPLNYYFNKEERVRKIKMKNREISANPEKMKNNKERERWSPVIDWRLDQSKANKREILHKRRFLYIQMFFYFAFGGILICKGLIFNFFLLS